MNTEPSTVQNPTCSSADIEMNHRGCILQDVQASEDPLFEPLLGVPEAAELLRCHSKTVQALARAGNIPCIRMGKYWRFRASTLDAWVREGLESDHQSRRVN